MRERLSTKDGERLQLARNHHLQGSYSQARTVYEKLLRKYPRNTAVQSLFGTLLIDSGEPEKAIPLLRRAAAKQTRPQPQNADANYNLGLAFAETGDHEAAIPCYRRAIKADPRHHSAHYNLGLSLRRLQRNKEAIAALLRDYELSPRYDTARLLSRLYVIENDHPAALHYADRCVELEGATAEDLDHLVMLMCRAYALAPTITSQEIDTLRTLATHAVDLNPRSSAALINAGRALTQIGDFQAALDPLAQAVQLDPEDETGHALYAVALLTQGKLQHGWHERTLLARMHKPVSDTGVTRWQGEMRKGLRLWVTREQGIGDQILYARMLIDLVEAGMDITLVCEERIQPLLARSMPELTLTRSLSEDEQIQQDAFATLGELHTFLRPDLKHIPQATPYLVADAQRTRQYRETYNRLYPGKRIVGLAWLSHSEINGASKSVPLDTLLPVLSTPDCVFVCVQYGDGWDELREHAQQNGYIAHFDENCNALNDLDEGAAQLAALDELVSVSNASVHMAGAMGVRCHVMIGARPVWHWFSSGDRSPWYTDVNLYRQETLEHWDEPVSHIAKVLNT